MMTNRDCIARAEARALLRVLEHYELQGDMDCQIRQDLEAFGENGAAVDLQIIGRRHAGTAAAAFCAGIRNQAPEAALFLALTSFTKASAPYRLCDSARWLALMFAFADGRRRPDVAESDQVLKRLKAAFDSETAKQTAVLRVIEADVCQTPAPRDGSLAWLVAP
jgi:hypothetical protein